jgi:hypothetical protein
MYKKNFLFAITALILASLACSVNINLPFETDIKTGPTQTESILIPSLEDSNAVAELTLGFGAGELSLSPGNDSYLIDGEASYNVLDLKPETTITNNKIKIENGNLQIDGIPNFSDRIENSWDFKVGTKPIALTIRAGAYSGDFDLGGLSLTNLHVADGASDVEINFTKPNLTEMQSLRYETGASNITLENLANANFNTMIFESGAGNYELDFSGLLQKDSTVFIQSGLSSLKIIVPESTNTLINLEGGLTNVTTRGEWLQSGNQYQISAEGPRLQITIEMSAGTLILTNP